MKMTAFQFFTVTSVLLAFLLVGCSGADGQELESESTVYELRTYTTHEGKLDDLHQRFENHTMAFFEKHGMTNIMYWTPQSEDLKDNTLIYLLKHDSRDAAEQSWQDFLDDTEWQAVYNESITDGPIVQNIESVYMTQTPYSPE